MKKYSKTNYYPTLDKLLDKIIKEGNQNINDNYYLITSDPSYLEEGILRKTDAIFNIELCTYNSLKNNLMNKYQLFNYHKVDKLNSIIKIYDLCLKHNYMTSNYNYAHKLYDLFLKLAKYNIDTSSYNDLGVLSANKLDTILSIYQEYKKSLTDNEYLTSEDIIISKLDDSLRNDHYIFIDKEDNSACNRLIESLDKYSEVVVLEDKDINEEEDYSSFVVKYLFSNHNPSYQDNHPYNLIIGDNMYDEVNKVLLDLYKDLIDNKLSPNDFALYYPDDKHLDLIVDGLNKLGLPHYYNRSYPCKSYEAISNLIDYLVNDSKDSLMNFLNSKLGYLDKLFEYNLNFKQKQLIPAIDEIESLKVYFKDSHSISEFSNQLLEYINTYLVSNEDTNRLVSFIKLLSNEYIVTSNLYLDIYKDNVLTINDTLNKDLDSVYLLKYTQPYSSLLNVKKIYLVGNNESINPPEFKNKDLILNEERVSLHLPTTFKEASKYNDNLKHVFSNKHSKIVLSYSGNNLKGEEIIISGFLKKLIKQEMFIKPIPVISDFIVVDKFKPLMYLENYQDKNSPTLNNLIRHYKGTNNQVNNLKDHQPTIGSISRLDVYNRCPFRYFVSNVLKIPQPTDSIIQPSTTGSLVHYVLSKVGKDLGSINYDNLDNIITKTLNEYIQTTNEFKDINCELIVNKYTLEEIRKHLRNVIIVLDKQYQNSDFEVLALEKEINYQDSKQFIKGLIDREDTYHDYINVLDYKSSSKDIDLDLAKIGFNIQMLKYLDILLSEDKYARYGAVLYFSFKKSIIDNNEDKDKLLDDYLKSFKMNGYTNPRMASKIDRNLLNPKTSSKTINVTTNKDGDFTSKSKVLDEDNFIELLSNINKYIDELFEKEKSGDISVYPTHSDDKSINTKVNGCQYCPYKGLCNYDVFYNKNHEIDSNKQFKQEIN
ncbi:MAG: PD-(D/E)XK nuclease family protein [Thomasclavelia sp.]|nr:PD-(D/E)XK nuclease family protein [Thomasclavelia sp.]